MKILALHTDFRIYWPARWEAFHKYLWERGHELDVIEIAGSGSNYAFADMEVSHAVRWHILFAEGKPEDLKPSKIQPLLEAKLAELNPDVIIAGAIAYPSGALAVSWALKHNRRVVCFDDAKNEAVKRTDITNWIKRHIYSAVDAMFYPAPQWIPTGQSWGFAEKEIFFGVDVVDNDFWRTSTTEEGPGFDYFLCVGRQVPKKHIDDVIRAYAIYRKEITSRTDAPPWKLIIVGDGELHKDLESLACSSGLKEEVIFKRFLPQTQIRTLMQNAGSLVLTSDIHETWGLVINEAMNCGCPVIASKECGAADTLVEDGVNGYKTLCGNIELTASRMSNLHNLSESQRLTMSKNARKSMNEWGLDRFCQGAFAACEHAVSAPKRKPSTIGQLIISLWKGRYNPD